MRRRPASSHHIPILVEGMGSILAMHASGIRGTGAENLTHELYVHMNGPPLAHADGLLKEALNLHFKGQRWHFTQISAEGQRSIYAHEGLVMRRHTSAQAAKLPFLCDFSEAAIRPNSEYQEDCHD